MAPPADQPDVPIAPLHRALKTICWGGLFAGSFFAGVDPFNDHDTLSINLVGIVGTIVLLVGLRDLPFSRGTALARRRAAVVALVVTTMVVSIVAIVLDARGIAAAFAQVGNWVWMVLLFAIVGEVMGGLGATDIAVRWRRLTVGWVAVGLASLVVSALLARPAGDPVTATIGSDPGVGWQLIGFDRPWGVVVVSLITWGATIAVAIWLIVTAVATMRWLRARIPVSAGDTDVERRTAEDAREVEDQAGIDRHARGPRLGRNGDRLIYFVDKDG